MHLQQQTTHQPDKAGEFAHNMVIVCGTSNKCASNGTNVSLGKRRKVNTSIHFKENAWSIKMNNTCLQSMHAADAQQQ